MDRGSYDELSPPDGDFDHDVDSPHSSSRSVDPDLSGHHHTDFEPSSSTDPSIASASVNRRAHSSGPAIASATIGSGAAAAKGAKEPKRRRACEACRRLKVQCNFESSKSDTCKRCLKANRSCVVLERRRRQVVANSVTELEKKLEALTATLKAIKAGEDHGAEDGEKAEADGRASSSPSAEGKTLGTKGGERGGDGARLKAGQEKLAAKSGDVIDNGLISMEDAIAVFDHFIQHMLPHLPIVIISSEATAQGIRQAKPILFLAILNAGSWILSVTVQRKINQELMRTLSDRILVVGEKSLELIQAIQICTVWYLPPGRFEELKYYQYIHNACVMAIDMGLNKRGTKQKPTIPEFADKSSKRRPPYPDSSRVESRRAWLGCYLLGSLSAQNFRRENLIRFSSFIEESIEVLESSPDAAPSDAILCQWIRLQHLADDVGTQFSIEDPASSDGLSASKVRFAVQGFESQLRKITSQKLPVEKLPSMSLAELHSKLYMHEVALHAGYNCNDDMQPPFTEDALSSLRPTQAEKLSAGHISSLSTCLVTIHSVFDTFVEMPVGIARNIPNFQYVRLMYAAVALTKLAYDTTFPDSEIGKMFSQEDFKVDSYFDAVIKQLIAISGEDFHATARTFVGLLGNLRGVFHKLMAKKMPDAYQGREGIVQPPEKVASSNMSSSSSPPPPQLSQQWRGLDQSQLMMQNPDSRAFGMPDSRIQQHHTSQSMSLPPGSGAGSVQGMPNNMLHAYAPPDAVMGEVEYAFGMGPGMMPMYFPEETILNGLNPMLDMGGADSSGGYPNPWPTYGHRDMSHGDG